MPLPILWLMLICPALHPLHAGWKELGTCLIRGILRDMLSEAGFGKGKKARKLGVGLPPVRHWVVQLQVVNKVWLEDCCSDIYYYIHAPSCKIN